MNKTSFGYWKAKTHWWRYNLVTSIYLLLGMSLFYGSIGFVLGMMFFKGVVAVVTGSVLFTIALNRYGKYLRDYMYFIPKDL